MGKWYMGWAWQRASGCELRTSALVEQVSRHPVAGCQWVGCVGPTAHKYSVPQAHHGPAPAASTGSMSTRGPSLRITYPLRTEVTGDTR